MGLLDKITYYSGATYISDLKYSFLWKDGLRIFLKEDKIENFSIHEWNDALRYIKGVAVCVSKYEDVVKEINNLLEN